MIDHFGINVTDLGAARPFYEACLAPLGFSLMEDHGGVACIFGKGGDDEFLWVGTPRPSFWRDHHRAGVSAIHVCFRASSPEAVDAFHAAGVAAGGVDNGPPGDRGGGYYAAYLLDPDGNNIEASHRGS